MSAARFERMLDALCDEARALHAAGGAAAWERRATESQIPERLAQAGTATEFLAWAQGHRAWSLTLAECATEVCGKPTELAVYTIRAIVEELLEDEAAAR